MPTNYPGGLDSYVAKSGTSNLDNPDHAAAHNDLQDAIAAIQAELGTNPAGASANVATRLLLLDLDVSAKTDRDAVNGPPTSAPASSPRLWFDLTNDDLYFATGTSSVADWILLNQGSGGGGAVSSVEGRTGVVTVSDLYVSLTSFPAYISAALSDLTSSISASTTTALQHVIATDDMSITDVHFFCSTPPGSSNCTFDIHINGTTIFSSKPRIDVGDNSTTQSAVTPVISATTITAGDVIEFFVDSTDGAMRGVKAVLSGTRSITGAAQATPGAPTNVTLTPGDQQITVQWTAPVYTGTAPLTDYIIEYKLASSGSWSTLSDGTGTGTSTIIGPALSATLTNGQLYDVRVSAVNSNTPPDNQGVPSAVAQATPVGGGSVPSAVTDLAPFFLAQPGRQTLTWTHNQSEGITDYVIQYSVANSGSWVTYTRPSTTYVPGGTSASFAVYYDGPTAATGGITHTPLIPNHSPTLYDFRIAAVNSTGQGPWSNIVEDRSIKDAPEVPTALAATGATGQVDITATGPVERHGADNIEIIYRYRTTAGPGTWQTFTESPAQTLTADSQPLAVSIPGGGSPLSDGVDYDFDIGLSSDQGPSPYFSDGSTPPTAQSAAGGALTFVASGFNVLGSNWEFNEAGTIDIAAQGAQSGDEIILVAATPSSVGTSDSNPNITTAGYTSVGETPVDGINNNHYPRFSVWRKTLGGGDNLAAFDVFGTMPFSPAADNRCWYVIYRGVSSVTATFTSPSSYAGATSSITRPNGAEDHLFVLGAGNIPAITPNTYSVKEPTQTDGTGFRSISYSHVAPGAGTTTLSWVTLPFGEGYHGMCSVGIN